MNLELIENSRIQMLDMSIQHLESWQGTPCSVYRDSVESKTKPLHIAEDVYGMYSGTTIDDISTAYISLPDARFLLPSTHFGSHYEGGFDLQFAEEHPLYTSNQSLHAGDIIAPTRADKAAAGFMVIREDQIGTVVKIMRRFIITPIMLPNTVG